MWPDWVSNLGPLTYESDALPTALRGPALISQSRSSSQKIYFKISGPGCSKLRTLLVNISLNFQKLISQICQYFLLKNVRSFCKSFSHFFIKKV